MPASAPCSGRPSRWWSWGTHGWRGRAGPGPGLGRIALAPLTLDAAGLLSAATGMAVAVVRGFGGEKGTGAPGKIWVDMTRTVLHVPLPLSVVLGLVLAWQGGTQAHQGATTATTLEGAEQVMARSPVAVRSRSHRGRATR